MNNRLVSPWIIAGLLLAGCETASVTPQDAAAPAEVTVEFANPDNYRDARESLGGHTDENALAVLRTYLQENAPAYLQSGQKLHVTFTDIDLTGEFQMSGGGRYDRVRLVKSIYIPRMELTFALTDAGGQIVKQGTRKLTDLNFQSAALRIGSDQPYFYDKVLLEDWLRNEFK